MLTRFSPTSPSPSPPSRPPLASAYVARSREFVLASLRAVSKYTAEWDAGCSAACYKDRFPDSDCALAIGAGVFDQGGASCGVDLACLCTIMRTSTQRFPTPATHMAAGPGGGPAGTGAGRRALARKSVAGWPRAQVRSRAHSWVFDACFGALRGS